MAISTLSSPGVEVKELDNSLRVSYTNGTTIYIPGFAAQGPVEEVNQIGSMEDFETLYGTPTNMAECYFYYTTAAVIENSGPGTNVLVYRLPYGENEGDNVAQEYTMLAYPAIPVSYARVDGETKWWPIGSSHVENKNATISPTIASVDEIGVKAFTTESDTSDLKNLILNIEVGEENIKNVKLELHDKILTFIDSKFYNKAYDFKSDKDYTNIEFSSTGIKKIIDSIQNCILDLKDANNKVEAEEAILAEAILAETEAEALVAETTSKVAEAEEAVNEATNKVAEAEEAVEAAETEEAKAEAEAKLAEAEEAKAEAEAKLVEAEEAKTEAETKLAEAKEVKDNAEVKLAEAEEAKAEVEANYNKFITESDNKKIATFTINLTDTAWPKDKLEIRKSFVPNKNEDITYLIGAPVTHQLTLNQYYQLLTGEIFGETGWSKDSLNENGELYDLTKLDNISHAAFITVNISRNIIDNNYQGYYIGISDNFFNVADDALYSGTNSNRFNAIDAVKFTSRFDNKEVGLDGINEYQHINENRLGFYLDKDYTGSISRVMQSELTKFDTSSELYDDTLNIGIFRLTKSTSNTNVLSLNYAIAESYNAAFGKERIQSVGTSTATKSYFIENETSNSMLMSIFVNPYISENITVDTDNILHGKIRVYGKKLKEGLKIVAEKYLNSLSKSQFTAIQSYTNIINRLGITPEILSTDISTILDNSTWVTEETFNNSAIYGFGKYTTIKNSTKKIGSVPAKVKRALKYVSNDEIYPDLDIVLEAGLGTIYAYAELDKTNNEFVDNVVYSAIEDLRTGRNTITDEAEQVKENYMSVQNEFTAFANSFQNGGRGDTFYIADILRGILIKGKNTKITQLFGSSLINSIYDEEDTVNHSWSTSVYHPINHLLDTFTTSYASVYAQWFKVNDAYTNGKIWVPSCGYVAALMARADSNYGPWYAAAGYNRGIIPGVLDCAINPDQSQRDDLYKICVNSIPKIGNIGITIWGIRTMSKKASCFDQNTCRRTFLHMEKTIKRYLRYYVFEPNNSYTQIAIYNDLDPYLEGIKNRGGIYSYTLICDDTVNTDEIVNDGEMVVRCEAAPTRTAEKIVLEMVANRKNSTVTAV